MVAAQGGPQDALAIQLSNLTSRVAALEKRDVLQNASIGAGGITVSGGGSITVIGGGSISLDTGTFTAGTVNATNANFSGTAGVGTLNVSGNINGSGAVILPNNTVISTYARNHQVVTGYVSAWIDSSGNILATASARKFKRDITPYSSDAWRRIQPVLYRLRAAWILADIEGRDPNTVPFEIGVIADDLLADFPELVVLDADGRPWSFHYERLSVVAIDAVQQLAAEVDTLRGELAEIRQMLQR